MVVETNFLENEKEKEEKALIIKAFSSLLFFDFSKQKGGFSMFLTIQCGGYQIGEYQKQNSPYMSILHYDDMTSFAETYDISLHVFYKKQENLVLQNMKVLRHSIV